MTQKKDPLVKHIRKYLKHRENAISCIEDYLNVDVQDYQPVYEVLDQWDYDNPNQRYYTLTKALVTLTNQQQALVKMGYFGQIDLLRDWTQEITKLKDKISPATFETNQTVVEQYNLLPTFALAFTNCSFNNSHSSWSSYWGQKNLSNNLQFMSRSIGPAYCRHPKLRK
jgi:hypothetical protein